MKAHAVISLFLIGAALTGRSATAAELALPHDRDVDVHRSHRVPRIAFRHRHRLFVWKRIGMPCMLTPDQIVRRNWNGPQCRWVDNL